MFVCFAIMGRQIEKFRVTLKFCNSLTMFDWNLALYVKVQSCNHGKDVPSPSRVSFGVEQHLLQTFVSPSANILVLRIKTSVSFLINLNSK